MPSVITIGTMKMMFFIIHTGIGRNNENMGRIDALEITLKEGRRHFI